MLWPEVLIPIRVPLAMFAAIAVPIAMFAAIAVPIYKHIVTRHRERIALIEKGIVTEDVKYLYQKEKSKNNPYSALKWGLIFVLLGLSLILARLVVSVWTVEETVYPAFISIGIGSALLIFYYIALKRQREGEEV